MSAAALVVGGAKVKRVSHVMLWGHIVQPQWGLPSPGNSLSVFLLVRHTFLGCCGVLGGSLVVVVTLSKHMWHITSVARLAKDKAWWRSLVLNALRG